MNEIINKDLFANAKSLTDIPNLVLPETISPLDFSNWEFNPPSLKEYEPKHCNFIKEIHLDKDCFDNVPKYSELFPITNIFNRFINWLKSIF
jgi:hypothetical protein